MSARITHSSRSRAARRGAVDRRSNGGYFETAKRPLQILAFLLPLIIAYEISLIMLLRSGDHVLTNNAHKTLLKFFQAFEVGPESGFYLGGIVVVVVLVVWHVLNRDPWEVDVKGLGVMVVESLVLALPLLVIGQLIQRTAAVGITLQAGAAEPLHDMGLWSKFAISIGAGLYEELMFRMLLIAVLHTLLVDVGKASNRVGAIVAVGVSAAAFTWYHPLGHSVQRAVFFFLAGLYFGAIYVARGFGIVVGAHAIYDIITFSLSSGNGPE